MPGTLTGFQLSAMKGAVGVAYKHLPAELEEAMAALKTVSEDDRPMLECNIGFCYLNGRGGKKDYVEARNWFQKAKSSGRKSSAGSLYNMGTIYTHALGVEKYERIAAESFGNYFRQRMNERQAWDIQNSGLAALKDDSEDSGVQ